MSNRYSADPKIGKIMQDAVSASLELEHIMRWQELYAGMEMVESPIEAMLLCGLAFMSIPVYFETYERAHRPFIIVPEKHQAACMWVHSSFSEWVCIEPQASVLKYRADFLVTAKFHDREKITHIVVECDGHDFHERTKDQAARDKKRDREMLAAGYLVVRFTGREVFKDYVACGSEVSSLLEQVEYDTRPA